MILLEKEDLPQYAKVTKKKKTKNTHILLITYCLHNIIGLNLTTGEVVAVKKFERSKISPQQIGSVMVFIYHSYC